VKPTIGRIVHFKGESGVCLAAVVTAIHDNQEEIELVEFFPYHHGSIHSHHSQSGVRFGDAVGTWHWPEREPADVVAVDCSAQPTAVEDSSAGCAHRRITIELNELPDGGVHTTRIVEPGTPFKDWDAHHVKCLLQELINLTRDMTEHRRD
jgi:hypothetical protein